MSRIRPSAPSGNSFRRSISRCEISTVFAAARLYRSKNSRFCGTRLSRAIGRLEGFKDSRRQLTELRELEDEGDRLAREAISDLFNNGADAIALIRWKDIHEQLEEAIDACENAADVLEAILVKNR